MALPAPCLSPGVQWLAAELRVVGQDWQMANLYEGRDLMPTSDTRQWIRAILSQHWKLNAAQLDYVFPTIKTMDSQLIRPVSKSRAAI